MLVIWKNTNIIHTSKLNIVCTAILMLTIAQNILSQQCFKFQNLLNDQLGNENKKLINRCEYPNVT